MRSEIDQGRAFPDRCHPGALRQNIDVVIRGRCLEIGVLGGARPGNGAWPSLVVDDAAVGPGSQFARRRDWFDLIRRVEIALGTEIRGCRPVDC